MLFGFWQVNVQLETSGEAKLQIIGKGISQKGKTKAWYVSERLKKKKPSLGPGFNISI
jgi:hypothetical protein